MMTMTGANGGLPAEGERVRPKGGRTSSQFMRYLAVGGVTTIIHVSIQTFCYRGLGMPIHAAWWLGFANALLFAFLAHYHITFRSTKALHRAILPFLASVAIIQAFSYGAFSLSYFLLSGRSEWADLEALGIAVAGSQVISFFLARRSFA